MIHFEYHLRNLRFSRAPRVSVLRLEGSEDRGISDVRAEILDLYPNAAVQTVGPTELVSADLAVVLPLERSEFPLQDVLYRRLDDLVRLVSHLEATGYVMFHRVRWRETEVVASKDLRGYLGRKRLERALVDILVRYRFLQRLLPPVF